MPDAFGLYQAAGIESPGGHQGWMTGSVRSDDDWTLASLITNHSVLLAGELGCASPSDLPCLQALSTKAVYTPSKALRFAPALAVEGEVPLGLIAAGEWNKVPVIVGGQSCESCESAEATFGPYTRSGVSDARVRAGLLTHSHLPFSPALAPSRCSALDGLVEGFGLFQSTICFKLVNWERPQAGATDCICLTGICILFFCILTPSGTTHVHGAAVPGCARQRRILGREWVSDQPRHAGRVVRRPD